jgi:uncharacterized protein
MLISFRLRNYKTFREWAEWSMLATDDPTRAAENVIEVPAFNLRLLKTAALYGANASGKSKLIDGLQLMRRFVRDSSRESQVGDAIPVEPFRLNAATEQAASEFEILFCHEQTLYRYGFRADAQRIEAEWLHYRPKTKEVELFSREGQAFKLHPRLFEVGIVRKLVHDKNVKPNTLLLSLAAQFNHPIAAQVLAWFERLEFLPGLDPNSSIGHSLEYIEEEEGKREMLALLQAAGLDVEDFAIEDIGVDQLTAGAPEAFRDFIRQQMPAGEKSRVFHDISMTHRRYDEHQRPAGQVVFSLTQEESAGTQRFFALAGLLLQTLKKGHILVADELDARLHPNLVAQIIGLFNSAATNPNQAQLLFNTHNATLLDHDRLRRDQIWFVRKDTYGAAALYSLADLKGIKVTDDYEQKYLEGRYGAVPYVKDLPARLQAAHEPAETPE